jgi:hypothetical protein
MDATVRISDRGPGRSFSIEVTGMDQIPWENKVLRNYVRAELGTAFGHIYWEGKPKVEVLFGDECPDCNQELKDGKCIDPTCRYNYEGEDS